MKQLIIVTLAVFTVTSVVFGQGTINIDSRTDVRVVPQEVRQNLKEKRDEFRTNTKEERDKIQADRKQFQAVNAEVKADFRVTANAKKAEFQAEFQAASSTEEKQTIRDKARTEQEEMNAERKEFVENRKIQAKIFIAERTALIVRKLNAGIDRGDQILGRLQLVAESSTADVERHFAVYASARAEAVTSLARAEAQIELAVSAETTEEARIALEQAKELFKSTAQHIKDMYGALRSVYSELKAARPDVQVGTDSQAEVTN